MAKVLTVYNTLSRKKEPFKPLTPGKVKMYVCGNTVYDDCHLGHARSMVSFDVIVRFLKHIGFDVTYVRNITDIDDKIINRANERGVSIEAITTQFINAMHDDAEQLGLLEPSAEPRATDYIAKIIALIETLIANNIAYVATSGDVCFEVARFKDYGKLSHKDIEGLMAGARIEIAEDKKSPLDFVLWKRAKENEPSWPSPWGEGRPGWHIECSAMALHELGETFDIHGGGLDLQFPHHENEIAQSEAVTHKPFANYWLHVGMLQINHEKMSKSLGNFLTVRDVLAKHHHEVVRYFLLSSHYRSPLNYTEAQLGIAHKSLMRLYAALDVECEAGDEGIDDAWVKQFNDVMSDDFNTPEALSVLFKLAHAINKTPTLALKLTLMHLGGVLGLLKMNPKDFLQASRDNVDAVYVEEMIQRRKQARLDKNWALADELRDTLLAEGIDLLDGPEGTTWRIK